MTIEPHSNRHPEELPRRMEGAAGMAELIFVDGSAQTSTSVGAYLIHAPGQAVAWNHYSLNVITLADVPGIAPAHKTSDDRLWELMLIAIDPENEPTSPDISSDAAFGHILPANFVHQFGDELTEKRAAWLVGRCARLIVDGEAPAEPAFPGGKMEWDPIVARELAAAVAMFPDD